MRRRFGSTALHLAGNLALLALAAYAISQVLTLGAAGTVIAWLIGAVVLHDAVLWPLYSSADGAARRALGPAVNHVRVPLGLSLLLALVFAGTVTGKGGNAYRNASGHEYHGYVQRWLIVTGVLLAVSVAIYLVRRRRT
jgi:hypothetical protein